MFMEENSRNRSKCVLYNDNEEVKQICRICSTLSLIPIEFIDEAWLTITENAPRNDKLWMFLVTLLNNGWIIKIFLFRYGMYMGNATEQIMLLKSGIVS